MTELQHNDQAERPEGLLYSAGECVRIQRVGAESNKATIGLTMHDIRVGERCAVRGLTPFDHPERPLLDTSAIESFSPSAGGFKFRTIRGTEYLITNFLRPTFKVEVLPPKAVALPAKTPISLSRQEVSLEKQNKPGRIGITVNDIKVGSILTFEYPDGKGKKQSSTSEIVQIESVNQGETGFVLTTKNGSRYTVIRHREDKGVDAELAPEKPIILRSGQTATVTKQSGGTREENPQIFTLTTNLQVGERLAYARNVEGGIRQLNTSVVERIEEAGGIGDGYMLITESGSRYLVVPRTPEAASLASEDVRGAIRRVTDGEAK